MSLYTFSLTLEQTVQLGRLLDPSAGLTLPAELSVFAEDLQGALSDPLEPQSGTNPSGTCLFY